MTNIITPSRVARATATGLKLITIQEFQDRIPRTRSRDTFLKLERRMLAEKNPFWAKRIQRSRNTVLFVEREADIFLEWLAGMRRAEAPAAAEDDDNVFRWPAPSADDVISEPTFPVEKRAEKVTA